MTEHSSEVKKRYASGLRYSPEATLKKRKTNCVRWIQKSSKKFPDLFDYSKAEKEYITQKDHKVSIFCNKHEHWFKETPDKHVQGKYGGCEFCTAEGRLATSLKKEKEKFLKWFKENREDRLEIKSEFKGMTELMTFRCIIHDSEEDYKPTMLMSPSSNSWDVLNVLQKLLEKLHA